MVVFGFFKILYFIRIYESYGFLVQMVGETFGQVGPFTIFFIAWIIFFSVCYQIVRIEIDSGDEEYLNLPPAFQYLLMTYRNSIGDLTIPGYENWNDQLTGKPNSKNTIILLIWLVWLTN